MPEPKSSLDDVIERGRARIAAVNAAAGGKPPPIPPPTNPHWDSYRDSSVAEIAAARDLARRITGESRDD